MSNAIACFKPPSTGTLLILMTCIPTFKPVLAKSPSSPTCETVTGSVETSCLKAIPHLWSLDSLKITATAPPLTALPTTVT
eukprot:CAMPEP_0113654176 /NCGR_PEP_ID=MMETSP0017_2-20120614/29013_1 /TAXON_ID=2856 /ORGANISM="Cylindrotheca closterium" /LENGTH=80 /DNA_ID=CAMNT_0000567299 /DNA_START=338 /DNA_END=576 /DNA_ORIENTATION=+ /assembly_acc=CAM_ASM_000147